MRLDQPIRLIALELLAVMLLVATTVRAAGGVSVDATPDGRFDAVERILRGAIAGGQVRGASLILVHRGEVLYKQAVGKLSVDQAVRIASSTKPLAAAAILTLVDDAVLSLDDPIQRYLPEFKTTKVAGVTLEQLLSHTAGMPQKYPGGRRPRSGTLADFSRLLARRGTFATPGEFRYSGVSLDIACRMAEAASGEPFETLIEKRLFRPLGMTNTEFTIAADAGSVSAEMLAKGEGRYVSCGGGLSSTLDDLAAFYQMLLDDGSYRGQRILAAATVKRMTSKHAVNPMKRDDPSTTGEYGLALYRDRVAPDGTALTVSHGGAFGSMPWTDLDLDLVGVFLSEGRLARVKPVIAATQKEIRALLSSASADRETVDPVATGTDRPVATGDRGKRSSTEGNGVSRDPLSVFQQISGGRQTVSEQEFIAFFAQRPRFAGRGEFADRIFKRLDANADGRLTAEEYEAIRDLRSRALAP